MRRAGTRRTVGWLAGMLLAGVASAEGALGADDFDRRVAELLAWAAHETGYAAEGVAVTVRFAEPEVVNAAGHGAGYVGQSDIAAVAIGGTILLPDWFLL